MSILARLSDLLRVNVHALLDRAEDPERMAAHLLHTLEEGLDAARAEAARALAAERGLKREVEQHRAAAEHWQEQGRVAVSRGRQDLARGALGRALDEQDLLHALEDQHAVAQELSAQACQVIAELEDRLAQARRRLTLLSARKALAQVRFEVQRHLGDDFGAAFTRFAQLERRLAEKEDEILAQVALGRRAPELDELRELERTRRIEESLARLTSEADAGAG